MVKMVFKNLYVLVLWTNVASALERLRAVEHLDGGNEFINIGVM